jgi:hypothetical protein
LGPIVSALNSNIINISYIITFRKSLSGYT